MICPEEHKLEPCKCEIIDGAIGIEGIAVRDEFVIKCVDRIPFYIKQVKISLYKSNN